MTRVSSLLASALVTTLILGCDAGPEDTFVPSEPAAPATVRPAALSPAGQGATIFKSRSKGPFANVFWQDGSIFGFLSVSLSQVQTGGKPVQEASLFYDIAQCDDAFNCNTIEGGIGTIPIEDVSGGGKKSLSVHTDTSTNPDFTIIVGSGGPVDVDWSADGFFSQSFHGVHRIQFGNVKVNFNGWFSSVSATAMGNVIGSSVPEGFGEMGTSHDRSMEIVR